MNRRLLMVVNHAGFFLSHRLPLALAARDRGWDIRIVTPRSKHVPIIEAAGLPWREIPLHRSRVNPVGEVTTLRSLTRLYRAERPALVHQVTTKPVLYGTVAARRAGVPAVVNALAGMGHVFLAGDPLHRILRVAVRAGFRFSLRHPRMKVIFQNEDDRSIFVGGQILDPGETVIIPGSGVDPQLFSPSPRGRSDPPLVILPSRMLFTKGVGEFVEAAQSLKRRGVHARFALVGESDPDNPASVPVEILRRWEAEGFVEMWGRREDMPAVYAQADLVVLPSYREGMPKVLIEAALCGLASVTADVPGCRDVVVDGLTGRVVPRQNLQQGLERVMEELLANAETREAMGRRARERALGVYTLERVIATTLDLYEEMTT